MATVKDKLDFDIQVTYFKSNGKFYTTTDIKLEAQNCGNEQHPICYMNDVVDHIEFCRRNSTLPGLQSGKWYGYILVECKDGVTCLITQ